MGKRKVGTKAGQSTGQAQEGKTKKVKVLVEDPSSVVIQDTTEGPMTVDSNVPVIPPK